MFPGEDTAYPSLGHLTASLNSVDSPCGCGEHMPDLADKVEDPILSHWKYSCFIIVCTISPSVLGDSFMQWKGNDLGVEFPISFCSGTNLGKPRKPAALQRDTQCLGMNTGCFLQLALWIHEFCNHRCNQP